jgi:hypothetical protein
MECWKAWEMDGAKGFEMFAAGWELLTTLLGAAIIFSALSFFGLLFSLMAYGIFRTIFPINRR